MSTDTSEKYYKRIKSFNITHYAGEVSYYSVAPLRAAEKKLLSNLPKGAKILDVGCGSGRFSINAAKLGFNVTGIDITPDAIRACKERAKQHGLSNAKFKVLDITEGAPDEKFDFVFCPRFVINAISTNERRRMAIDNMYRACNKDGALFVESFNILYLGKGPVIPLINVLKAVYRSVRIKLSQLTGAPYDGLFPGDITYPANKAKGASDGYAHLPSIFEVKSYLKNGKTQSIYEVIGDRRFDVLRPFRYSIWTIDRDLK